MKKNLTRYLILSFVTFFRVMAFSQTIMRVTEDNFSALGWQKAQINKEMQASGSVSFSGKLASDFVYIACFGQTSIPKLSYGSIYMSYPKETMDDNLSTNALPNPDPTIDRCLLFNYNYHGTRLRDITELKY